MSNDFLRPLGASTPHGITRRRFVEYATASVALSDAVVSGQENSVSGGQQPVLSAGLLVPKQNRFRNILDLSGIWEFQIDPEEVGQMHGWPEKLPNPRPIPVPCSWNDLFDDVRNYLGVAWYLKKTWIPTGWKSERVFIRVGSANYAAKVWLNGKAVTEHLGGHLPFQVDITRAILWDNENTVVISVENKQLVSRVPPGPGEGGGGVAGVLGGFPLTTYDFFPYSGLHRPVLLYSVPAAAHIDDVTVATAVDGKDGVVTVKVAASGGYAGKGKARLGEVEAELSFRGGASEATLRMPGARLWSPSDPHLYPLTVTLSDGQGVATD